MDALWAAYGGEDEEEVQEEEQRRQDGWRDHQAPAPAALPVEYDSTATSQLPQQSGCPPGQGSDAGAGHAHAVRAAAHAMPKAQQLYPPHSHQYYGGHHHVQQQQEEYGGTQWQTWIGGHDGGASASRDISSAAYDPVPMPMMRKRDASMMMMMTTTNPATMSTSSAAPLRPYESKRRRQAMATMATSEATDDAAAAEGGDVVPRPHPALVQAMMTGSTATSVTTSSTSSASEEPCTVRLVDPRLPSTLFNRTRRPHKAAATETKLVQRITHRFAGFHTGTVNTCRWSSTHGVFLATASMDKTVKIWDAFAAVRSSPGCVATLRDHTEAVMDVRWNVDNSRVLSGSLDKTVILTDLETCRPIHSFKHKEMITTVAWHPRQHDLFLAGGFSKGIVCWDARSNSVVAQYKGMFGTVQAMEWIHDGKSFVSSSDITKRNSVDKAILVWDFEAAAVISNQVYQELFTCPYLKTHPSGSHFIAQSNANYIAIFSTKAPFKRKKDKKFMGHRVDGCHIGCDISPDGSLVATGSSDGSIHFYSWHSGKSIKVIRRVHDNDKACSHVAFHPLHPQVVASCGWDGAVVLLGGGSSKG